MDKFSIQPAAQPYIEALKALIPTGVHTSPSLETSCLIDLPIVITNTSQQAPAALRADTFINCLEQVVNSKLQGNDQKTAQILFGLGEWAGVPMRDRYEKTAKLHNRHWKWENFRKEPLDRFLLAVYIKLYREGERISSSVPPTTASNPGHESSPRSRQSLVGGNYITNRYESLYNLPSAPGKPRQFLQTREITATRNGVEAWRQSSRYWGKGLDELPEQVLFGPGTLGVTYDARLERTDKPGRAYVTEVKFPHPLKAGDRTKFAILKTHRVEFDEVVHEGWRDWCGLLGITVQIERAIVGVRFPPGITPRTLWYFEDLPEWLAPGVASEDNTLSVDGSGFVTHSWDAPLFGHSYGLAWMW